jgi:hypothetical protein
MIWRLRWGERWVYVYLLLEFQSRADRLMAVRLLTYVGLLYEDLAAAGEIPPGGRLPPVLPLVLYNGSGPGDPGDPQIECERRPAVPTLPRPSRPGSGRLAETGGRCVRARCGGCGLRVRPPGNWPRIAPRACDRKRVDGLHRSCVDVEVGNGAEITDTDRLSLLPSPQPLSVLGRGAQERVVSDGWWNHFACSTLRHRQ